MTKEELIKTLVKETKMEEEQVSKVIKAFGEEIREELKKDKNISIPGFGTFVISGNN